MPRLILVVVLILPGLAVEGVAQRGASFRRA